MLKRLPLHERHVELGAKMGEFAGFCMPMYYRGVIEEVRAVRQKVGMFDVSHMGELSIKGKEAVEFVNYITVNDVGKLRPFSAQYSMMCNTEGGIVDDLIVYRLEGDEFMLVVNAANISKDYEWVKENSRRFNVQVEDISDRTVLIAVQGPKAIEMVDELMEGEVSQIRRFEMTRGKIDNVEVMVSRTGYTGEDGVEIYVSPKDSVKVWDSLMERGKKYSMAVCGLIARDVLRLEAGLPLYGNDIDETTTPWEARLGWVVKLNKGEFIGRESLKLKKERITKHRVGIIVKEAKIVPRKGQPLYFGDEEIGYITSGGYSPTLGCGIGMGYVNIAYGVGTKVEVDIRGKRVDAEMVKLPFYRST